MKDAADQLTSPCVSQGTCRVGQVVDSGIPGIVDLQSPNPKPTRSRWFSGSKREQSPEVTEQLDDLDRDEA